MRDTNQWALGCPPEPASSHPKPAAQQIPTTRLAKQRVCRRRGSRPALHVGWVLQEGGVPPGQHVGPQQLEQLLEEAERPRADAAPRHHKLVAGKVGEGLAGLQVAELAQQRGAGRTGEGRRALGGWRWEVVL